MGSFSCSIPPLFVLSHSMPMINTTGKLASFWRFSIAASSLPSASRGTDHRPLFPRHSPLPPRHPPEPAGSGRAATLPHWLLPDTDRPGSREVLLPPRSGKEVTSPPPPPLRTARESFPSCSSSLSNALCRTRLSHI